MTIALAADRKPIPADQFAWYRAALKGEFADLPKGIVASGYYRARGNQPIGIWRTHDGRIVCVAGGRSIRVHSEADLAESVWSWCCRQPIPFAVYETVVAGGPWPEDIAPEIEAARDTPAGIGHNSGVPHEIALDELAVASRAFGDWLKSIGGKILNEEHDAKAEEFRQRFMALEKKGDLERKKEKQPHLDAERAVDARWRPAIEKASAEKVRIGAVLTPYRNERARSRKEAEVRAAQERARIAAEHAKAAAEAARINAPLPEPPPPSHAGIKPRTGLRTVKSLVIDDLPAAVGVIMALPTPPAEFIDVVKTIARRMIEAGVPVEGARIQKDMVV